MSATLNMVLGANEPDAHDLFCGAGGSAIGLERAGVKVRMAANHWDLAIKTHQTNFPDTDHDLADISQVNPRRYPRARILWASPECTNYSGASGRSAGNRKRDPLPRRDPATGEMMIPAVVSPDAQVRSRATMWDVVRFSEFHRYDFVIVENVYELATWELFGVWRLAMEAMGYQLRVVCLNSMFAGGGRYEGILPAPQSRDRVYVVAWRKGMVAPNLDFEPLAWCVDCAEDVHSVQTWKPKRTVGRYRRQYTYNCPRCVAVVEPYTRAAAEAIDWTLPGQRIGDRDKPLAEATMHRIEAGLRRFAHEPGLVVPVERGHDRNKRAWSTFEALPTQTARATQGVAFTPFIASLRGGGSHEKVDPVTEPMATVSAKGNHHLLVTPPGFVMRNNNSSSPSSDGSEMCTPFWEPFRTITTKGHQSIVIAPHLIMPYNRTGQARPVTQPMHTLRTHDGVSLVSIEPDVDDCEFRMLQPHEQGAGMGFPGDYVVLGTKRDQTHQYGNAVTPPASELLATAVIEALLASEHRAA